VIQQTPDEVYLLEYHQEYVHSFGKTTQKYIRTNSDPSDRTALGEQRIESLSLFHKASWDICQNWDV